MTWTLRQQLSHAKNYSKHFTKINLLNCHKILYTHFTNKETDRDRSRSQVMWAAESVFKPRQSGPRIHTLNHMIHVQIHNHITIDIYWINFIKHIWSYLILMITPGIRGTGDFKDAKWPKITHRPWWQLCSIKKKISKDYYNFSRSNPEVGGRGRPQRNLTTTLFPIIFALITITIINKYLLDAYLRKGIVLGSLAPVKTGDRHRLTLKWWKMQWTNTPEDQEASGTVVRWLSLGD